MLALCQGGCQTSQVPIMFLLVNYILYIYIIAGNKSFNSCHCTIPVTKVICYIHNWIGKTLGSHKIISLLLMVLSTLSYNLFPGQKLQLPD